MSLLRPRTAVLLLRFSPGPGSRLRHRALETVLRAAGAGVPAATRAVARAVRSLGPETVWQAWLDPSVSGSPPARWGSSSLVGLLEDAASVPDVAVDAAWCDSLTRHDAALWALLERWGRAASGTDPRVRVLSLLALGDDGVSPEPRLLAEAAVRFDHPIGERARERLLAHGDTEAVDLFCVAAVDCPDGVAFCTAHGLAPSEEVPRAVFFVRTGQHEQCRALDGDGALLALGYRAAPPEERSLLREAMTALGDVDTLRVMAGQRHDDFASLTERERAYLVRRSADRRDWNDLWRLTVLMPLAEAVETARAFGEWRPDDEDDRRLFDALRGADPQAVRGRVAALRADPVSWPSPHTRISLRDLDARAPSAFHLDFSPDGEQVAFAGPGIPVFAGVVELRTRTLARLYSESRMGAVLGITHLGSETVLAKSERFGSGFERWGVHYADPTGGRRLDVDVAAIRGVDRAAGDRAFVILAARGQEKGVRDEDRRFTDFTVLLGEGGGPVVEVGVLDGLRHDFYRAAVDPGGRMIAALGRNAIVVADLAGSRVNVLDDAPPPAPGSIHVALSPSVLIRGDSAGHIHVWHEPLTTTRPPLSWRIWPESTFLTQLAWSSTLNRFVAMSLDEERGSVLWLLDVPATRETPPPDDLVAERVALAYRDYRDMRLSPEGDMLAVGGSDHTIDLYALTALALRPVIAGPMGSMGREHLADVTAALGSPVLDAESRPMLELLRACLEYRFRHDIGIGGAEAMTVTDHDLELGG